MEATRSGDLERGMDLLARLPEVMPDEADTYARADQGAGVPLGWIPIGPAQGTVSLPLIAPHEAPGQIQTLFEAIARRHGHPLVATYYRALANWPQFLRVVWDYLEPIVGSAAYARHKEDVIDRALQVVRRLSLPRTGTAAAFGVTEAELADIRALLAVFRLRLIPDILLDVTLVKALLDGGGAARSSRFSVAAPMG